MKLPLANQAEVPKAKIVLYLLNREHRRGKSKARFFLSRGFDAEHWQAMAGALRRHAAENKTAKEETTPLGVRVARRHGDTQWHSCGSPLDMVY